MYQRVGHILGYTPIINRYHASQQVARDLLETDEIGASEWGVEQRLNDISRLLLTVRDLQRVGDHAVNIAARTLYMVENDSALLY